MVVVLKALVEDGQMLLADGRRLVAPALMPPGGDGDGDGDPNVIPIHPAFKLFVLANRPGYPFLGNDLFREAGDCFSVHIVANPPPDSQVAMLRGHAADGRVPDPVLRRLPVSVSRSTFSHIVAAESGGAQTRTWTLSSSDQISAPV